MELYTILLDYKGGTYVSQLQAKDEYQACLKWAQTLNVKEIAHIGIKLKEKLVLELCNKDYRPILLKDTINVWFTMALVNGGAFIHIIKTVTSQK